MDSANLQWRVALVGLMLFGLLLAACAGTTDETPTATVDAPQGAPQANVDLNGGDATPSGRLFKDLTINVNLTDNGFEPASIYIPLGRRVQLVVRNRDTTEHHYRIVGLVPEDLLWLAPIEDSMETNQDAAEDAEHTQHHNTSFLSFRVASPAGIRPFGDEVHAYASAGDVDMVIFTPTNTGTFIVQCPLHPEIVGKVTVF